MSSTCVPLIYVEPQHGLRQRMVIILCLFLFTAISPLQYSRALGPDSCTSTDLPVYYRQNYTIFTLRTRITCYLPPSGTLCSVQERKGVPGTGVHVTRECYRVLQVQALLSPLSPLPTTGSILSLSTTYSLQSSTDKIKGVKYALQRFLYRRPIEEDRSRKITRSGIRSLLILRSSILFLVFFRSRRCRILQPKQFLSFHKD